MTPKNNNCHFRTVLFFRWFVALARRRVCVFLAHECEKSITTHMNIEYIRV